MFSLLDLEIGGRTLLTLFVGLQIVDSELSLRQFVEDLFVTHGGFSSFFR